MEILVDKSPVLTRCSALTPHFAFHTFQDRVSWCKYTEKNLQLMLASVQIPWFIPAVQDLSSGPWVISEMSWTQHALIGFIVRKTMQLLISSILGILLCRFSHNYFFFFCFNYQWFFYLCFFSWTHWLEYKGTLVRLLKQNPQWSNNNSALSLSPLVIINSS